MIELQEFGTQDGLPLVGAKLTGTNSQVTILSLGAITQNWQHSSQADTLPMVLGYENLAAYQSDPYSLGAIVGRVANRTAFGQFTFEGRNYALPVNKPPHHLHGGSKGMHRWNFDLSRDNAGNSIILTHTSPDGHMGYPGNIAFTIKITLCGNRLMYEMIARPDRPTPINLAQHSYYNLSGTATCRNHILQLQSAAFAPVDTTGIPTGQITKSQGTRCNFTAPRALQQADPENKGYDIYMTAACARDQNAPLATLSAGGRCLKLWSDQPGLQVYDAMHLGHLNGGHGGRAYRRFAGLALEPQAIPNILNMPKFGSIIYTADQPYRQITAVEISVD